VLLSTFFVIYLPMSRYLPGLSRFFFLYRDSEKRVNHAGLRVSVPLSR